SNRQKARLLVARAQEKVANQRLDLLHKLSTKYIRENQTVALENLNVSGMLKNRRLAKSISDSGWRMFKTLLEYKASRYGREVVVVCRWEPTSKRCASCRHLDGKKSLAIRRWTCSACGAAHDRDINAAKNILAVGQAERLNACGAEGKSSLLVPGYEAGTRLDQGVLWAT
ncbi:MAG: transposase, partial [Candidatus Synechococcus spongiarum 15L]